MTADIARGAEAVIAAVLAEHRDEGRSYVGQTHGDMGSDDFLNQVLAGTCANDLRRVPPHETCTFAANAAVRAVRGALRETP